LAGTPGDGLNNNTSAPSVSRSTFLDVLPASCDVLRDYQREQLTKLAEAIRNGIRRIIVQAPTGAGKTHLIAAICAAAVAMGLRVLVLATRTRLVRQIHERLEQFHVGHGVIAAELRGMLDWFQLVQVAGVDTLHRRCMVDQRMPLPFADVVLFDECHHAAAESRLRLIESYPTALLVGFTATPARKSGRPLSDVFDVLIPGLTIPELIQMRMLVRPRVFCVPIVTQTELDALKTDMEGDYQSGATGKLMSKPKLIGDVRENLLRIAPDKKTLIFAVNKAHGQGLTEELQRVGIAAELLTDQDDEETREAVIERLERGDTTVVVNCFLMAYGVDIPCVECIVLARPTRSVVMYLQMVGRGLRTAPGKESCIVIDHGRVVENLGRPTDEFEWSLEAGGNVNKQATEAQSRKQVDERPRTCGDCSYTWAVSEEGSRCPNCGWTPKPRAKSIAVEAADLVELDSELSTAPSPFSPTVQQFFREALGDYIRSKPDVWTNTPNKARAASWHATRERFEIGADRIPSIYWELGPTEPTAETRGWLKYRRIKFARSRALA
jgi:superfamily II DNA or RNA helicase